MIHPAKLVGSVAVPPLRSSIVVLFQLLPEFHNLAGEDLGIHHSGIGTVRGYMLMQRRRVSKTKDLLWLHAQVGDGFADCQEIDGQKIVGNLCHGSSLSRITRPLTRKAGSTTIPSRSEEHTSELQSLRHL